MFAVLVAFEKYVKHVYVCMCSAAGLGPVSCSLLSGYERLFSAKKVTIDNVAFHVPYLDYAG